MAPCGICAHETCDVPLPRNPNVKYSAGDVYSVRDSVYTPINLILKQMSRAGSAACNRSCMSLKELTSTPDVIRGGRPAVIMQDDDGDDSLGHMVCLATTYSGEDISNLPRIFRHFSIPIAPNMLNDHGDHVHGLPEWDKPNAFLIGWPFRSTATCEGIWDTQVDGKAVPQVLGSEAMKFLRTECKRRRKEWQEMRKDAALADELEAEVRDHIEKRRKEKEQERSYGTRNRSRESVTSVNSAWWRSSCRCPETIPEENVFPAAFGKRRQPSAKQVTSSSTLLQTPLLQSTGWSVGKPITGSTYYLTNASAKEADGDWISVKSNGSRTSLAKKAKTKGGLFNKFDVLRAVRVNVG